MQSEISEFGKADSAADQESRPVHPGTRLFQAVDTGLARLTEAAAALLVLAEVLLLGTSTAARYLFARPFAWSDELASMLFLWLAMLGAVIALRRGEHMRLTAFVRGMRPEHRAWLDALALMLVSALLLALVMPSFEHYEERAVGLTPVLQIGEGWRSGAMLVGAVLMLFTAVDTLIRHATWTQIGLALVGVAAAFGALLWLAPVFEDLGNLSLLVFFLLFVVVSMATGMPIAFAFLIGTVSYIAFATTIPLSIVPSRMEEGMSHLILLAVPLFVLLGALMEISGLAQGMIAFLVSLIGHLRGGLQYVLLGAMYLVSGISGAKAADMAAVAPALFPEMRKRGNHDGDLTSLLSASAVMSETIPPSIVLITVGSVTGVSIAALFTGGLMPAFVGMLALCVVVWWQSRSEDLSSARRFTWGEKGRLLLIALPGLGLPVLIRTAVVEGVATATEVSTIGVLYSVLVGVLVYRRFDWRRIYPILIDTASLSGAILLVVGAATAMAWALTQSGFSQQLVALMALVPGGQVGFLLVSALAFIVLGSVLEGVPAIVLFGPLLFPIARQMGVNEVHYAMIAVFAMGFGLFTPPFGVGFYLACAIGRVSPDVAIKRAWPHLAALLVALILIVLIPWISIGFL
ncbi:TRAP transporter large permease subunit [Methylobacterium nodulans]|uniref:TRAP C4-dicarboxylate transport system permease DctM subunit n=1 Tax=Methylobacterium nodulans (strain LMG 21967 / CNCM I-2342 / ORS 2060) TaxID=460265 RepID=B8IHV4_METNO|nr:TRAP transporter large permease subunit [Methylobacterium nodulans]ACL55992.1 TRAP C4-dicarboxylate transport system permease DctM subunit [Methylobacterium nodulans ORS 2060]